MPRAFPPGLLPLPSFTDPEFCTPGAVLNATPAALRSQASNAIQAWGLLAQRQGHSHNPTLPVRHLLNATHLLWTKEASAKISTRGYATLSVRMGPRPDAAGLVICVFADMSVALLRSDGPATPEALYAFCPTPLMLAKRISSFQGAMRALKVGNVHGTCALYFARKGEMVTLSGRDPAAMDLETGGIYAGIIAHAIAWGQAMDRMGTVRVDAPDGLDWGADGQQGWFIPPCLPHAMLTPAEQDALGQHFEHALTLIWARVQPECAAMSLVVETGMRKIDGKAGKPVVTVRARSSRSGNRDSHLERTIQALAMRALHHKAVPTSRLFGTALYWPADKKRERPQLLPIRLFAGGRNASEPAHTRLRAHAAIGQDWLPRL